MSQANVESRFLSKDEAEALVQRIGKFARGGGLTVPVISSWWSGELRWGRNRVNLAGDRRDIRITVTRIINGSSGRASTNQTDDTSLEGVVRAAERGAASWEGLEKFEIPYSFEPPMPALPLPKPVIWSDATYNLAAEARGEIARKLVASAEAVKLLSAGYIEVRAGSVLRTVNGVSQYDRYTQAQCSMTVRDAQGRGSGWAGLSSYDWAKIDAPALAQRALDKCLASRNPVALEPGRYTVILEPQAVADFLQTLMASLPKSFDRQAAELGQGPFALPGENFSVPGYRLRAKTKLGLKVMDPRVTLSHDPEDPELGILPELGLQPLKWVDQGVLVNLSQSRINSMREQGFNLPIRSPEDSYRMSGGDTSIEQMIATTKRGLLVTRFSNVGGAWAGASGVTRDGIWLIENGKITKPVKNFWFAESPLFALNQLEQLGRPVPVFRPVRDPDSVAYSWVERSTRLQQQKLMPALTPVVVPPIKVRDFSFNALADAF